MVVSILNNHLEAAVEAILEEGGTIDKFVGDAVMAWFNAPILQPDHTLRAVRAALGIRKAIQSLHAGMPSEHRLSFGVGIQCGEVVLGVVGAEKRMDYTAIGDCINTAKRIQENTSPGQILISSQVYARVKEYVEAFPVDPIQAKGKRALLEVYEVSKLKS